jgi:hypothetical protein
MTDTPAELARDLARVIVARFPPSKGMTVENRKEMLEASATEMTEMVDEAMASLLRATGPVGSGLDLARAHAMVTLALLFQSAVLEIAMSSVIDESETEIAARICARQAERPAGDAQNPRP